MYGWILQFIVMTAAYGFLSSVYWVVRTVVGTLVRSETYLALPQPDAGLKFLLISSV
jgi:hypothetical protein